MELKVQHHEAIEAMTGEKHAIFASGSIRQLGEEVDRFKATHKVLDVLLTARTNEQGEHELVAIITYEDLDGVSKEG